MPTKTASSVPPKRKRRRNTPLGPGCDFGRAESVKLIVQAIKIGKVSPQNGPVIAGMNKYANTRLTSPIGAIRLSQPIRYTLGADRIRSKWGFIPPTRAITMANVHTVVSPQRPVPAANDCQTKSMQCQIVARAVPDSQTVRKHVSAAVDCFSGVQSLSQVRLPPIFPPKLYTKLGSQFFA